jgi:hypothetical protein
MPDEAAVAELVAAGLLERGDDGPRTSRRWQAAMARAATRLHAAGAPWMDLRLPVVSALLELVEADDETLVRYTAVMLSVESAELTRGAREPAADPEER